MERTYLYRHWDKCGTLLYLGISNCVAARTACHRSRSPWSSKISRTEIEEFQSRQEALAAETKAIATEAPLFNLQGRLVCIKMAKRIFEQFGSRSVHEIVPEKIYETAAAALFAGVSVMELWGWMYDKGALEIPIKRQGKRKSRTGFYGRDVLAFIKIKQCQAIKSKA